MLKILVIGSGAREHAIVRAINRSPKKKEIHCLATNYNPLSAQKIPWPMESLTGYQI